MESSQPEHARFEVLPLGRSEEEASRLSEPVRLTVTCSPKHGPDRTVEVAGRLHALGHPVTAHIAARMIRDRRHLDALLGQMAEVGIDDLFLIGGDADPPEGCYSSAVDLLPFVAEHSMRPQTIGIAGYPEGHPLIADETLDDALLRKSQFADYVTTQMCFQADAVRDWVSRARGNGLTIPVLVGMPGKVARTRLLEMSVRIGVGPSLAFLRKQRGIRNLLSRRSTVDRLYGDLHPMLDDPELNIAGFHFFTFNQLVDTWSWQSEKQGDSPRSSPDAADQSPYATSEERTA
jgi:methylenetetrahydrofolate reductase (NADPH)